MLLQERVDIRKVPDVPGKTIQLIDYQDIAEATLYISTHILTRRMTNRYRVKSIKKSISTHILTRRMTEKDDDIESEADISTHILTRRMTC